MDTATLKGRIVLGFIIALTLMTTSVLLTDTSHAEEQIRRNVALFDTEVSDTLMCGPSLNSETRAIVDANKEQRRAIIAEEQRKAKEERLAELERERAKSRAFGFKSQGVINANGWRYTWYSSNWSAHYQIGQWILGDDKLWRTSDGYIVVACVANENGNPVSRGAIVPTPFGPGKVLDSGCAAGTIDIYTAF